MIDPPDERQRERGTEPLPGERLVYLVPETAASSTDDRIHLRQLWNTLWRGKWVIVVITAISAFGSVTYALVATEWYRAEVLLAPAESQATPTLVGQLGGLAALAGVATEDRDTVEAIALLTSRDFLRSFIVDNDLMPVLFSEQWNIHTNAWRNEDSAKSPDLRDGVDVFQQRVLEVNEDRRTGLVQLAVEWQDPELASEWAMELVRRLNILMRTRALQEAEANVRYLQDQLQRTNVLTLQQTVGRLLEVELQKLMLAQGREEYAFKVLDPPETPKQRVHPRRTIIAIIGTFLGAMSGVAFVLSAAYFRQDSGTVERS